MKADIDNLPYFCDMSKHQEHDDILVQLLKHHGLRNTTFRKEVLGIFRAHEGRALSHNEIERELDDWDRITLYRTLKSFEVKGLIHQTPDINGIAKYAICGHSCNQVQHDDRHAHFHCTSCNTTLCLHDSIESLHYSLPQEFVVLEAKVILNGICASCN